MRLFWVIFKTLWSLHNELIWLGLPNYTDHISLPLHVQILTANGFLCCCALCPVMPIFCFFVCHHVKTEVWPHISCNQTLLYYRFCRLAFLAPQLQKSGKIAIRVFGGLTDTVLHAFERPSKKTKFFVVFCRLWSLTFQTDCEIDSDRFWSPNSATILWLSSQLS